MWLAAIAIALQLASKVLLPTNIWWSNIWIKHLLPSHNILYSNKSITHPNTIQTAISTQNNEPAHYFLNVFHLPMKYFINNYYYHHHCKNSFSYFSAIDFEFFIFWRIKDMIYKVLLKMIWMVVFSLKNIIHLFIIECTYFITYISLVV